VRWRLLLWLWVRIMLRGGREADGPNERVPVCIGWEVGQG
jgi:hypothetical protein